LQDIIAHRDAKFQDDWLLKIKQNLFVGFYGVPQKRHVFWKGRGSMCTNFVGALYDHRYISS